MNMELLTNHRCDALVHERAGGTFIAPKIDATSGPAVLGTQKLFPDQSGHVSESWCGRIKRSANLIGGDASRQFEAANDGN